MTRIIKLHGKYFELQQSAPENLEDIMQQPVTDTIAKQVAPEKVPDREPDQVIN